MKTFLWMLSLAPALVAVTSASSLVDAQAPETYLQVGGVLARDLARLADLEARSLLLPRGGGHDFTDSRGSSMSDYGKGPPRDAWGRVIGQQRVKVAGLREQIAHPHGIDPEIHEEPHSPPSRGSKPGGCSQGWSCSQGSQCSKSHHSSVYSGCSRDSCPCNNYSPPTSPTHGLDAHGKLAVEEQRLHWAYQQAAYHNVDRADAAARKDEEAGDRANRAKASGKGTYRSKAKGALRW